MFKYYIYKFGQFCVTRLPLAVSYRLAIFLSDTHYLLSFRDRKAVKNNLKVILNTDENVSKQARQVFRNFGLYLVEFFRMAKKIDSEFVKEKVKIENLDYLKGALNEGKGGIILSAHIGNWELGGFVFGMLGYPTTAIALPHKERPVNDLFNQQREFKGVTVVPSNHAIRRCLETLKANKLIVVVADRDFAGNGIKMDFLGRKKIIPKGAAIFSCKTGAPIIPTFMIRNGDGTFRLILEKPIKPPVATEGDVDEENLLPLMREHTDVVERFIRKYPTQWLLFRKFWTE